MPTRIERPSKKMRSDAWKALHNVVTDPEAPIHAVVSASRALVRDENDDDDVDVKGKGAPPVLFCMPSNRRDPGLEKIGLTWNVPTADIRYHATPEDVADRDRWIAEYRATIARDFPPDAPPPKLALTDAEKQRLYRERKKAKLALLAAPVAGLE